MNTNRIAQFLTAILVFVALSISSSAQLSQTTLSGYVYDQTGVGRAGIEVFVVKTLKDGQPVATVQNKATSTTGGAISLTIVRGSTIYLYSPDVPAWARNGRQGVPYPIPDSSTYSIENLALLSSVYQLQGDTAPAGPNGRPVRVAGNTADGVKFYGQIGTAGVAGIPAWWTITGDGLSVTQNNSTKNLALSYSPTLAELIAGFGTQSANRVLASPNGSSGAMTVRALVADDIPTLAQSKITDLATDLAGKQPLDSDLTSIAALSTTSFGRGLLTETNAASLRTTLGLATVATSGSASDLSAGTLPLARLSGITNTEISASAAIAYSKLNLAGAILNADLAGSIAISKLAITGTPDGTKFLRDDGSWQTGGSGAGTALDNLASVNINTSLLAQTGVDAGSTTKPFRDLYLYGGGTYGANYFRFTGTPTAARTITMPDASITVARTDAAQTFSGSQTFDTIPIITNSAPGLVFTDTTASAKSLTVAVDANLAQFRESAGASGSLLVLDLANSRLGLGTATPGAAIDAIATAQSGVAETLFKLRASDDATAQVEIYSNTSTDGVFAPAIRSTASRNVDYGLSLTGQVASGLDTGTTPLVAIVGQRTGGGALTSRNLFGVFNATTAYLRLDATGNLAVGSGNILGRIAARGTTTDASANALWLEDSAGTGQFVVRNNGLTGVGTNSPAAQLDVRPVSSSTIGQIVRLASGQTANALNVENSTGTLLSGVLASGAFYSAGIAFASLGTPSNGTFVYCSDCTIASPCASGGTGALAKRLNGAWVCN